MENNFKKLFEYASTQDVALKQGSNAVFMLSENGKMYHLISKNTADSKQLLCELTKLLTNDRVICAMICFLPPHQLDLPSFDFRKALAELDLKNRHAAIYLKGDSLGNSIVKRELYVTMP